MTEYSTQPWAAVVAAFRELADAAPAFRPLADAVEQLSTSPFAAGLHPVKSMHTLQLYHSGRYRLGDEQVRLDVEDGAFVVRHLPQATGDPRLALDPPTGIWTKKGPDAAPLLARAFHHLRWFIEYAGTNAEGPDRDAAV